MSGRRNTALNLPVHRQLGRSYNSCWRDCVWKPDIRSGTDLSRHQHRHFTSLLP